MTKTNIKLILTFAFTLIIFISFLALNVNLVFAQESQSPTVCCEKTISGLYCQDVPASQCDSGARQVPTSCKATSYCKPGTCFDSSQGTCLDNTPQNVCNLNNGIWTDKPAPQCELGCCVVGDQAAFVTLTRCKKLSSSLGLETNYKKDIKDEVSCISSVLGQEKGACVFESEFQKTCRLTTRADCSGGVSGNNQKGDFFPNKLCSAEELGTNCGPSEKTMCVAGKEEVYFVDTCGNPANIYDSSKVNDKEYWTDIKDKTESCNPNAENANNPNCGNCNYIQGSFCRETTRTSTQATYGDNICGDLNCVDSKGTKRKHGESWCVNDDKGVLDKSNNAVGSRYYKHICINGEEVLEACADFRQQECIEDKITTTGGEFSQAACRVNRWQECTAQTSKSDCENTDKRDCTWNGEKCIPLNSPGLKFWEGNETAAICNQASVTCTATSTKGLFGGEKWSGDCVTGSGSISTAWAEKVGGVCYAMGDCSGNLGQNNKINWLGDKGRVVK